MAEESSKSADSFSKESIQPISWEAPEFESHRRGTGWYVGAGILLAALLAFTIYIGRWILGAVVVMVGVVLYLSGNLRPKIVRYRIDSSGVTVGEKTFSFEQLKSFWFTEVDGRPSLNLISTVRLMPVITIKIKPELIEPIRKSLGKFLPESENKGEDWIDRINRFLKV